jgi:hypothetical protein
MDLTQTWLIVLVLCVCIHQLGYHQGRKTGMLEGIIFTAEHEVGSSISGGFGWWGYKFTVKGRKVIRE